MSGRACQAAMLLPGLKSALRSRRIPHERMYAALE
jgi:hypothetical protein